MNQNLPKIDNKVHSEYTHIEGIIKLIIKATLPLVILAGGLILLVLRLPGWGIILGLPMVVIGVVFLIYTYDEVVSSKFGDPE